MVNLKKKCLFINYKNLIHCSICGGRRPRANMFIKIEFAKEISKYLYLNNFLHSNLELL